MRKVRINLDEDVYVALREAYSLKELEVFLQTVLTEQLRKHVKTLKKDDKTVPSPGVVDVCAVDPMDHSPHEWTH